MVFPNWVVLFGVVVCLVHATYFGYGELLKSSSISKVQLSTECDQTFLTRTVNCISRNLKLVPRNFNRDILRLALDENKIETLYNTSFFNYPLLFQLSVGNNKITVIESASFQPLKHLEMLDLFGNRNLHIPSSDIFRWSENLSFLDLAYCSLLYFPNNTLRWLPRIGYIDLSYNSLSYFNMTYCPMGRFRLNLSGNRLYHLTLEAFSLPCKLDVLYLADIPFAFVDPRIFGSLQASYLLIGCKFNKDYSAQRYFVELFTGISQSPVEYVIVNFFWESEFILPLHAFILPHKKRLSKLALENGLSRLQPHVFRNLTNLYRIEIHVTEIREIAPCYFYGMYGLRELDLGQNEIVSFNPYSSVWNINITKLYLNSNNIVALPKGAFRGLNYLLLLDLSNNILTQSLGMYISSSLLSLNISRTGLPKTFNLPNLQRFYFSGKLRALSNSWSIRLFFMPNRFRQCLYLLWIQIDNSGITLANTKI